MSSNQQPVRVTPLTSYPLVQKTCFVVVPNYDVNHRPGEVMTGNCWRGPFATKEEAQREAARWMLQGNGWLTCGVFSLVGTVTKPIPDLSWHEPVEDSGQ